jgi:hypothetical protein
MIKGTAIPATSGEGYHFSAPSDALDRPDVEELEPMGARVERTWSEIVLRM